MTFQRVLRRNGLEQGDYDQTPERHRMGVVTVNIGETPPEDFLRRQHFPMAQRLADYERAFRALTGDLRRLEHDARDEGGICRVISSRTGIDADVVAAVLMEFIGA